MDVIEIERAGREEAGRESEKENFEGAPGLSPFPSSSCSMIPMPMRPYSVHPDTNSASKSLVIYIGSSLARFNITTASTPIIELEQCK